MNIEEKISKLISISKTVGYLEDQGTSSQQAELELLQKACNRLKNAIVKEFNSLSNGK